MYRRMKKALGIMMSVALIIISFVGNVYAYNKDDTVYMAGNSHIDTCWKWDTSTTVNQIIPGTFGQAVNLIDDSLSDNDPNDYKFNSSAALHHLWTKQFYPDIFQGIKSKVASGHWNLVGGQWVEADTNLSSGESLVRQTLFGQRFFKKEFGVKSKVGWLPDVFGFSGQLPQILKKSGMDYFVTAKLNWNDTNEFPYELFNWKGIDGTSLTAYKNRENYDCGVHDPLKVENTLENPKSLGINKGLFLFGQGDGGGGPNKDQINTIMKYNIDPSMPSVKTLSANDFFEGLTSEERSRITDTWNGEMYLEKHRGTYTSQALIKKNNRKCEIRAEEAEKFSSIANLVAADGYPQDLINDAWEKILQNQMHDILPGSCTPDVAAEAHANGQAALDTLGSVLDNAIEGISRRADTTGTGVPIIVYNPLSFGRKQPVETTVTFDSAPSSVRIYDNGTELPSQVLSTNGNTAKVVFIVDYVQPVGFKVVHAVANTGNYLGTGLSAGSYKLENQLYRVELNSTTGNIKRIYNKANSHELLASGLEGNQLQILDDTPRDWNAWDVDKDDMEAEPLSRLGSPSGIELVENGPVKVTYAIRKKYNRSSFVQYITLYNDIDRIDIRMTADWQETEKMLKVAFPWNVPNATTANYEMAYGTVERSTQRETDFDKARFEVPAHKWADVSNGGFGVSLLNDCKYGYDTLKRNNNNTMRLSLLRSPVEPDPNCDRGKHEFTYAIYPHSGDWKDANTVFKGYELNYPLMAYQTTSHSGDFGKAKSFLSVDATNVIISVLKKAEHSSEFIVRMYETQGKSGTTATIALPGQISSISETNLLEERIGSVNFSGNTFATPIGKYEIKTFKVDLGVGVSRLEQLNFSKFKTATASHYVQNEEPKFAVDKTTASKWCATNAGDKWLTVDMGGETNIKRWSVMHSEAGGEPAFWNTRNFKLQTSLDGANWIDVDSVTDNTSAVTNRKVDSVRARYARLYITQAEQIGNNAARIYEFEVFGETPTKGVTFYEHENFGGEYTSSLAEGDYKLSDLQPRWFINDWASSVYLPWGYTVQLFDEDGLNSNAILSYNQWVLSGDGEIARRFTAMQNNPNDRISSVRVRNGVTFYENIGYSGRCTKGISPGKHTLADLQKFGFSSGWASSVVIPEGWYVVLYGGDNFTGAPIRLDRMDANSENFVNIYMNDNVSSVIVGVEPY